MRDMKLKPEFFNFLVHAQDRLLLHKNVNPAEGGAWLDQFTDITLEPSAVTAEAEAKATKIFIEYLWSNELH
jgi:hypothetical protein